MEYVKKMFAVQEDPCRPIPKEAYGWRLYVCVACAALAAAINGYQVSFIGGAVELPGFVQDFGNDFASLIISLYTAGSLVGGVMSYFLTERFGRRMIFYYSFAATILGAILQMASGGIIGLMCAGRFVAGLAGGFHAVVVPIYISEIAPPTIRGWLVAMAEVMETVAGLVGFWICYAVEQHLEPSTEQWLIPFALQLGVVVLLLPLLLLIKESPRWLVKKGKNDNALKTISWIRNLELDHDYVKLEFEEMTAQIRSEYSHGGHGIKAMWRELTSKGMKRRLFLAMAAKFFHSSTGATILDSYSIDIFGHVGASGEHEPFLLTGIYGAVQALFTFLFAVFVDKIGRRKLLFTGYGFILVGLFYLGVFTLVTGSFDHEIAKDSGSNMAKASIYAIAGGHAFSWAAFPEVFTSEVFPTRLRALAMMLVNICEGILGFVIAYGAKAMIDNLKSGTFFLLWSISFVGLLTVYCLYPETKGFPLEKMDYIFNGSHWARKARKDAAKKLAAETEAIDEADSDVEAGEKESADKGGATAEVRMVSGSTESSQVMLMSPQPFTRPGLHRAESSMQSTVITDVDFGRRVSQS